MAFDPTIAAIRFGTGLSPDLPPPASVDGMMQALAGPDVMAERYPIRSFEDVRVDLNAVRDLVRERRVAREANDADAVAVLAKQVRQLRGKARMAQMLNLRQAVLRGAMTEDGLRERLTYFWADHFTAKGKQGIMKFSTSAYVTESIRPHVAGRFADMLRAVVVSPLMLTYLDQNVSLGPNSETGQRRKKRGLNENLAREILELHTLGVGGPYSQTDVRELAELLTGLTYRHDRGFTFDPKMAEPGAETVLGVSYGGGAPRLRDVLAAMDDLARHPETARHLSHKLAVHFVSDTPDADLVAHMTDVYLASDGDLLQVTRAMLDHPASWSLQAANVKLPFDFVTSSLRALAVPERRYQGWKWKDALRIIGTPMRVMGQEWEVPLGPDGWPEEDAEWITPVGIAGRIQWAMTIPDKILQELPDPRDFVETALGPRAPQAVHFAAQSAETQAEGIGLVLASPAFQRR
ncbi:DUF1800 domain-containing protein [Algirhabdus cladophorae]|uniref:DUF1800 domain-containing protein n=1 Tax=Algirhabdus cladophorae TaxID=3377108 RepID=UPI003B84A852